MTGREGIKYSVIIPALNEAEAIGACMASVDTGGGKLELIVADGGSTDGTPAKAKQGGAKLVSSGGGRGAQMNAGAAGARGAILVFLHADTRLPSNWLAVLEAAFAHRGTEAGTFRLRFEPRLWALRPSEWLSRFDSVFTSFGDQGIAIRRPLFEALGGFPAWPLFEDVCLLQKARKRTRVVSLPAEVVTSSRRFQQAGVLRQKALNARLLFLYLAGASPEALAERYRRRAPEQAR